MLLPMPNLGRIACLGGRSYRNQDYGLIAGAATDLVSCSAQTSEWLAVFAQSERVPADADCDPSFQLFVSIIQPVAPVLTEVKISNPVYNQTR
jgi:hypothetical protein